LFLKHQHPLVEKHYSAIAYITSAYITLFKKREQLLIKEIVLPQRVK